MTIALGVTGELRAGWVGAWSPGIGDPNVMGWVTVVAYLWAAYLCFAVHRSWRASARSTGQARTWGPVALALLGQRRRLAALPVAIRMSALWNALALGLLLLGINKQLDLQTALTEIGRILAAKQGWYEQRQRVQIDFIIAVVLVGVWLIGSVLLLAGRNLPRLGLALVGIVFLCCFVAIRASSFHHVDRLLGADLGGLKINWIMELGGIALVGFGAYSEGRALKRALL
ncbi:MAG TPA: hypothetical protein VLA79_17760 [Polyangia bacterium]|nr:hypothetical protein [Polyangia bacterium]